MSFSIMRYVLLAVLLHLAHHADAQHNWYNGKLVGTFSSLAHSVAGTVYAVNDRTLRIIGFSYDGSAPDAFLWGGETDTPDDDGFIIPKEDGSEVKLGFYSNVDIEVTLPPSKTVSNLRTISVWCRRFGANFGHVTFASGFVPPSPYNLGALGFSPRVHGTSATAVVVLNPKEIRFENLFYDGLGPDAYFWVGPGDTPSYDRDYRIPDETGSNGVISGYSGKTVTVTLPDNITVFDIGHIGLWCVLFTQDFGHVDIPAEDVLNIPPIPKSSPSPATTTTAASTTTTTVTTQTPYNGKLVGTFSTLAHSVAGTVYTVNDRTLRIIGFTYDGFGPDAFLWGGDTTTPSDDGFIIPKEDGSEVKLGSYSNVDIEVTLPPSKTVSNLRSISVWCRAFRANFGHVTFASGFVPPSPYNLGALGFSPRVHNTSATAVVVLNTKEFRFENLFYDGLGPDAYFWVGPGDTPSYDRDYRIPDETGSNGVISKYSGQTVTVTLPDNITVFDIGHIGLWCVLFTQDFGHVDIPAEDVLNIPPLPKSSPSPATTTTAASTTTTTPNEFTNCETLVEDELQVSWYIDGPDIVVRISSTNDVGTYTAFGVSGSSTSTQMVGGDVVVTFVDADGVAQAVDYYLSARAQCSPQNGAGACPDLIASTSNFNDVTLIESSSDNGVTHIVYRRPLAANDATYDKVISKTGPTYVIWARGLINADSRVAYHSSQRSPANSNLQINFGRASSTCPPLGDQTVATATPSNPSSVTPPSSAGWTIEGIVKTEDAELTVEMGLTGGAQGYNFITGNVGWGIAWFIDGQLIPELTLTRGKTYKFFVSGGDNPAFSANYHPFYITDDPSGGYAQLSIEDKKDITIYAGPEEGPLCQWTATSASSDPDSYATFTDYKDTLTNVCQPGAPGELEWTVPLDAPDLLYYHCYTHRFLGWKIHLVDGDEDMTSQAPNPTTNAPVTDSVGGPTSTVTIIATAAALFAALASVLALGWWFQR